MRLEGKTAIVTGAGRGLGKGIALKLAQEGASVMICDMVEENAQSVVKEIEASGGKASYQICNVAVLDEVNALFEKTLSTYGKVDILVNNAGINRDSMLHKMSVEQWDQVIAVNLTGTFYMTQAAAKLMREQESGAIINISSASWLGNVGQANYAASKAGVVGLMTRGVPEKVWDIMVGKIPMGRAGKPSDVANMVAFLASEEADYITGEVINVGGGMVL